MAIAAASAKDAAPADRPQGTEVTPTRSSFGCRTGDGRVPRAEYEEACLKRFASRAGGGIFVVMTRFRPEPAAAGNEGVSHTYSLVFEATD